jgi:hypothetical protein
VEFRFVDAAGHLLKSKTWDLHQERHEPPQALLLQADAKLIGGKPKLQELGPNYVTITTVVESFAGELVTAAFVGFQPDAVNQRIAAFPLSLGVVLTADSIHFSLFTAKPKENE